MTPNVTINCEIDATNTVKTLPKKKLKAPNIATDRGENFFINGIANNAAKLMLLK